MAKLDRLPLILDLAAAGATDSAIAKALDVSTMTLWNFMRRSVEGDEKLICEWGGVTAAYHTHRRTALLLSASLIEQKFRSMCLEGVPTPIIFGGKLSYVEDEQTVGWTEDDREDLGYPRDGLKRDASGARIPLYVNMPVPAQIIAKAVEAFYPKTYGKSVDVHVQHGGVLRLSADKNETAKQIEHQQTELLAPVDSDPRSGEADQAAEERMAVGPVAESAAQFDTWADAGAFEPKQVAVVAADGTRKEIGNPAIDRDPENPVRKALEYEIAARAARVAAEPKKPPQAVPVPPEMKPSVDDDLDDFTGQRTKLVLPTADNVESLIASVEQIVARGTHLGPHERQIANRLKAEDMEGARALAMAMIGPSRAVEQDNITVVPMKSPGTRVV
jgi:hypothetical protein